MHRSSLALILCASFIPLSCGRDPAANPDGESGSESGATESNGTETSETGEPILPGGPCEDDSDCIDGEVCVDGTCTPDESATETSMGCGGELYQADSVPPNVLIVLDRSGSMQEEIGDQGTKWEIARTAIAQLLDDYGDQMFFGLMLYPGLDQSCDEGMDCGPGAVFIDVGADTGSEITDYVNGANTCSFGTPTAETLDALHDYSGLEDPERPNYILLLTDGQSSCDDPVPVVASLRDESPEIRTFVVGFGEGVDPSELEDMADAGGTALPGDPNYYQADDAQSLSAAFGDIAGSVLSCSYELDQVPPDPDKLYIYIDDMLIDRDVSHNDGWDYDPMTNQITFYGMSCQLLQSGQVMDLQIIFGCPEVG